MAPLPPMPAAHGRSRRPAWRKAAQTITASETNAAGLTGSASLNFTYDTAAPTVTVALAHDTGGTNNITSNDALTGTADANATVTLSEGSTVLGSTTTNASGAWSFTPTGLAQGSQTITASETNAAGLTGSSSVNFTYDTAAPTVTVALAHDTGGTNNITSNDALTGTADANATVTLSEGSTVLGSTTANASGVWSFTPTGLAQGAQTVTASETNAAGLTGSCFAELHLRHRGADRDGGAGARHRRHQQHHVQRRIDRHRRCQCHGDAERRLDRARQHHCKRQRRVVVHADRPGARRPDRHRQRNQCRRSHRQCVAELHLRHRGADRNGGVGARHRRYQQHHCERRADRHRRRQCHGDAERRLDGARQHHRQCQRRVVVHADRPGARRPDRHRQRNQCRGTHRQRVAELHLRHRGARP